MLLIITPPVHSWCKMTNQQEFSLLPGALQTLSIPLAPKLSDRCHLTKWQGRLVILTQAYLCYWYYYFIFLILTLKEGFPGGSVVKNLTASVGETGDMGSIPRSSSWEDPLEKEIITHTSMPAWKMPWTEAEVTTHSSDLAWKTPWTEGPGQL